MSQIQQFITQDVDVILATPFDREALIPAYEAAQEAEIPILSFANKVDDKYETAFLGEDWTDVGVQNMEAVVAAIGGSEKVAILNGPPQIEVAKKVSDGWRSVLSENPDIEVVSDLTLRR